MKNVKAIGDKCCGCSLCANICPRSAIEMIPDRKGFFHPIIDDSKCNNCEKCYLSCPINAGQVVGSELYPNNSVYAARIHDLDIRKISTSGGLFVAISDYVLERGGYIFGAKQNMDFSVEHTKASTKAERDSFCGSKYIQSNLKDIFKQVLKTLDEGKLVLFSGTPCQVAGLRTYLGKPRENLLLIDLICHGVGSPVIFEKYLEKRAKPICGRINKYEFRNKKYGWKKTYSTISTTRKTYARLNSQDEFSILFSSFSVILMPACYSCRYTSYNRVGDISIGDYWGIEKVVPKFDDDTGVSLVVTNTKKGEQIFNGILERIDFVKTLPSDCNQPNLYSPSRSSISVELFWEEYFSKGYKYITKKYCRIGLMIVAKSFIKEKIDKLQETLKAVNKE